MRALIITLAFLAACSPAPSAPASEEAAATSVEAAVDPNAATLGTTPQTGAWVLRSDEGTTAAGFGAPESEYLLVISCETPTGKLSLVYEHELSPDQDTTLRVITPVQTLDLPARSFNEGLPTIIADAAENTPAKTALIAMLGAPTDRFAVEVNGESAVFPWADDIAEALIACR